MPRFHDPLTLKAAPVVLKFAISMPFIMCFVLAYPTAYAIWSVTDKNVPWYIDVLVAFVVAMWGRIGYTVLVAVILLSYCFETPLLNLVK